MIAAVALKHYATMGDCTGAWVEPCLGEPEAPDGDLVERYAALFPIYREGYARMGDVWGGLARNRALEHDRG